MSLERWQARMVGKLHTFLMWAVINVTLWRDTNQDLNLSGWHIWRNIEIILLAKEDGNPTIRSGSFLRRIIPENGSLSSPRGRLSGLNCCEIYQFYWNAPTAATKTGRQGRDFHQGERAANVENRKVWRDKIETNTLKILMEEKWIKPPDHKGES